MLIYVNQGILACQETGLARRKRLISAPAAVVPAGRAGDKTRGFGGRIIPYSAIELALGDGVAIITLDRAESNNRLDELMADELREAAGSLSTDDDVRVIILTGKGPVFSVGRETPRDPAQVARLQTAKAITAIHVPVLAAINGDAADQGLELALAADLRVTTTEAQFWFSPPSSGNFHFDGGTQRLPRLVGPGWARDMLLTGRRLAASEALGIGLVNRVAAPGEKVLDLTRQLARQILEGSALGARYVKEAVWQGADLTLGQGLSLETDLNVILQSTADRAEGIASFLERRQPNFIGE